MAKHCKNCSSFDINYHFLILCKIPKNVLLFFGESVTKTGSKEVVLEAYNILFIPLAPTDSPPSSKKVSLPFRQHPLSILLCFGVVHLPRVAADRTHGYKMHDETITMGICTAEKKSIQRGGFHCISKRC